VSIHNKETAGIVGRWLGYIAALCCPVYNMHCKNSLTTEWLPWLQTRWRDHG